MSKLRSLFILGLVTLPLLTACYVREVRPACPYGWVPEHYGPAGRLIPGHCR